MNLLEVCEDIFGLGASIDVVAAFVQNHRAGLERDDEIVDEQVGGMGHAAPADAVVMHGERREVLLHTLPKLHV